MTHRYYEEDHDMNNESRMKYFDEHFKSNALFMAREKGIPLSKYLSQIKNFSSFKAILKEVFSIDGSLANYVEGMSNRSFKLFYQREVIQDIIDANKEEDDEYFEDLTEETPIDVRQSAGIIEEFFKAEVKQKATGKVSKVIAKKESVKVRGKEQLRYRDAKGRFVRKI